MLMQQWVPFINDVLMLLDGEGTFRHWKYSGAYADQPYIDIVIYRIIQNRWVELKNEEMQRMNAKMKNSKKTATKGRGKRWR